MKKKDPNLFDVDEFFSYYTNKNYFIPPKSHTAAIKTLKMSPKQMSRTKGFS